MSRDTAADQVRDHGHVQASGAELNQLAFSATVHCLTGCVIGEVTGMVIGTSAGFSEWGTVALAVSLAFLFGYTLTSLPLLRSGIPFASVVPIALAADTVSIAIMEVVDNAVMLLVPGAMEAGLDAAIFWGPLLGGFAIAFGPAFLVNKAMIQRGKGHAVAHEYH